MINLYLISLASQITIITISLVVLIILIAIAIVYIKVINKKENIIKYKKNISNTFFQSIIFNLGSYSNILTIEKQISKIKITLKDINRVNSKQLKQNKYVSGVVITNSTIYILVGRYSEIIFKKINSEINLKKRKIN